jgi:hypothetical protein
LPPTLRAAHTKQATMIAMLSRPEGATLEQLVEATGWLAHSVRGGLTNMQKHLKIRIVSEKTGGIRVYRIAT